MAMHYRELGNTGLRVSEISFGTIPILSGEVSILPYYYGKTQKDALDVLEYAYNEGVNLYDTAVVPEYGDAETKIGEFAKRHKDIIISDKARAYDYGTMTGAIDCSLRNLSREYCDIYFVHQVSPENQDMVFGSDGALDALVKQKQLGKIRFTGIATHHSKIFDRAINDSRVDVVQFPSNVLERGIIEKTVLCDTLGKGLLVCKIFAAGILTDFFSAAELCSFVLSYPISSAVVGFGSIGQVKAVDRATGSFQKVLLPDVIKRCSCASTIIPCIRCQECSCSKGLEIASIFRYYNYYMMGHRNWAYNKLLQISNATQTLCRDCGEKCCVGICKQGVVIPEKVHEVFLLRQSLSRRMSMNKLELRPGRDYIGVGVGGVIIRDGMILLVLRKRPPECGFWSIPGGKVEFGETVEEALLREIQEELGVEAHILAPLGVTNHILKNEGVHFVAPRFLVSIIGDPKNQDPEAHSALDWFPIDMVPENTTITTRAAIAAFQTYK